MKYFFLSFSLLIIVVGCSSLTEQQRYDDHAYPRSGDIDIQRHITDSEIVLSGSFIGQYTRYDDLLFSGQWDSGIQSENDSFSFQGTGKRVVGEKNLGLALESGSLFFGDGSLGERFSTTILQDIVQSDSLIISQEIDELSLLHIWWEGLQTQSFNRDKITQSMKYTLSPCEYEATNERTDLHCPSFSLEWENENIVLSIGEKTYNGSVTIMLLAGEKNMNIDLPHTQQTLSDLLLGKNQQ